MNGWSRAITTTAFMVSDYKECLKSCESWRHCLFGSSIRGHPEVVTTLTTSNLTDFGERWRISTLAAFSGVDLDGTAGERDYGDSWVPDDLYRHRTMIGTGSSPFARVMEGRQDRIMESVFLNASIFWGVLGQSMKFRG